MTLSAHTIQSASCPIDDRQIPVARFAAVNARKPRWAPRPKPGGAAGYPDAWHGVLNVVRDKATALAEMHRVLAPAGRLQVADIVLARAVPERSSRSRFGILAP